MIVAVNMSASNTNRSATLLASAALVVVAGTLTSCSDDAEPAGDASRFCGEIQANAAEITAPVLDDASDIEPLVQLYRDIAELAPLSIEQDWDQLVLNLETASTVVPGDSESEQRVIAEALRSEKSAVAVRDWLITNCEVDIGPVDTIAPQGS